MTVSAEEVTISVTLPQEVFVAMQMIGLDSASLAVEMKRASAIDLFRKGLISIGKAAELAGMSLASFMDLLSEAGVAVAEYTFDDIEQEKAILGETAQ